MFDELFNGAKGFFRTLGGSLAAVGTVMCTVPLPQVQLWGQTAITIGGLIAGFGAARAGVGAIVKNLP